MTFTVTVERTKTDGEPVLETHDGVIDLMNPPAVTAARLKFADGRDPVKVALGQIISVKEDATSNGDTN